MSKALKLMVFAHLRQARRPCGQLLMTEEGTELQASSFAYGLNYASRADALEVDPVSLGLRNPDDVRGKRLLPVNQLPFFGGIRDAAPDAWGRRVIEAKLKVPANSLPESQYLLHAGSDRVGALDIRTTINDGPSHGATVSHELTHLLEAADRIEEGQPVPAHLEAIFMDGTGLGGARPKASVRDQHGVLWLAKFSSRKDSFDNPGVECTLPSGRHPRGQHRAVQAHGPQHLRQQRRRPLAQPRLPVGPAATRLDIAKIAPAFRHLDEVSTPELRKHLP